MLLARLTELLLGLDSGFLSQEGVARLSFTPVLPGPPWAWTFGLLGVGAWWIWRCYRAELTARWGKALLGLRLCTLVLLVAALNGPELTLTRAIRQPSVVAILIDQSQSMAVADMQSAMAHAAGPSTGPATPVSIPRWQAAVGLLTSSSAGKATDSASPGELPGLLAGLAKQHEVRLYTFGNDAHLISGAAGNETGLSALKPTEDRTNLSKSLQRVTEDLAGQRLAGVVVLTDGREVPQSASANPSVTQAADHFAGQNVPVVAVVLGADRPPKNLALAGLNVQESAFANDLVLARATLSMMGMPAGNPVTVRLVNGVTGEQLAGVDGKPATTTVTPDAAGSSASGQVQVPVEVAFRPGSVGTLDVKMVVDEVQGEIDTQDNSVAARMAVMEARVVVLFVDGDPRWEYRYLKNELIRDKLIDVSCLLASADTGFAQEGDRPITRFPTTMEELATYDVIVLGDVSPRYFSDAQLRLIEEFVSQKGGGLAVVAGVRHTPGQYRGTVLEKVLPVRLGGLGTAGTVPGGAVRPFRIRPTEAGTASGFFRFLPDAQANAAYIASDLPSLFWYGQGVSAKPGVSEVYAEHPTDSGPDGRPAPLLVAGRYGAGRTIFSAIDDSWRWRYYTGESAFNTYWVQQLHWLARSRRLGQRTFALSVEKGVVEVGQNATVRLRVLDGRLLNGRPPPDVEIKDEAGMLVGKVPLVAQDSSGENWQGTWKVDRLGTLSIVDEALTRLTAGLGPQAKAGDEPEWPIVTGIRSRLELEDPRPSLQWPTEQATRSGGKVVEFSRAREEIPRLLPSRERIIPQETRQPILSSPLMLGLFIILLTLEWVGRKLKGLA